MTEKIILLNDHPDLQIMIQPLVFAANSCKDLSFLILENFVEGATPPLKFLVFFDNMKEAEAACKWVRRRLPNSLQKRIRYFYSTMTSEY